MFGELSIGDTVNVRGPKGQFNYTPNMCRAIGMIAGGTGITPMLQVRLFFFISIADWICCFLSRSQLLAHVAFSLSSRMLEVIAFFNRCLDILLLSLSQLLPNGENMI